MAQIVHVLSSNGTDHYAVPVDPQGKAGPCPCKAGQNERKCRHLGEAERMAAEQEKPSDPPTGVTGGRG